MFWYVLNIILTITFLQINANMDSLLIDNINTNRYFILSKNVINLKNLFFVLLIWTALYSIKGLTGTDSFNYYFTNKYIYNTNISFREYALVKRDLLYHIIEWGLSRIFHGYWIPICAIYALLLYIPILYVIKKESIDIFTSCLIYIFSMNFYYGFNGLRQGIAMGFTLIAYNIYFRKCNYLKYILFMIIAFGFHNTAMFIVPMHIITMQKFHSIKTIIFITIAIFLYIFMVEWWGGIIGLLNEIGQKKIAQDYKVITEGMKNRGSYLRIMVSLSVFFIAFIKYKNLKERFNDFDNDIWILVICVIGNIFISKFVYFARLVAYVNLSIIFIIPKLAYAFGDKRNREFKLLMLILYFIHMIVLLYHGDSNLYPFKPVWISNSY